MVLLRQILGETLRNRRRTQRRTLRDVAAAANVSLGYLSEVERGHKEASSELLAAICTALEVRLSEVLEDVSANLALAEHGRPSPASSVTVLRPATDDAARVADPARPQTDNGRVAPAVSLAEARARRRRATAQPMGMAA